MLQEESLKTVRQRCWLALWSRLSKLPVVWTLDLEPLHHAGRWLGHMSSRAGMHFNPIEVRDLIQESGIFKAHHQVCFVTSYAPPPYWKTGLA